MRFLAVAVGTVVGGVIFSTVLALLLVGVSASLGFGNSSAGSLLLALVHPAGFALAGWASYRQYGMAKPGGDALVADAGAAQDRAPEKPAAGKRVTPWVPFIAILAFIAIGMAWIANAEREAGRDARAFCPYARLS